MRPILLFSWYNTAPQKVNLLKRKNTKGLGYIPGQWDILARNRLVTPSTTVGVMKKSSIESGVETQSSSLRGSLQGGEQKVSCPVTAALCVPMSGLKLVFLSLTVDPALRHSEKKLFLSSDDCIFNQPRAISLHSIVFSLWYMLTGPDTWKHNSLMEKAQDWCLRGHSCHVYFKVLSLSTSS